MDLALFDNFIFLGIWTVSFHSVHTECVCVFVCVCCSGLIKSNNMERGNMSVACFFIY